MKAMTSVFHIAAGNVYMADVKHQISASVRQAGEERTAPVPVNLTYGDQGATIPVIARIMGCVTPSRAPASAPQGTGIGSVLSLVIRAPME